MLAEHIERNYSPRHETGDVPDVPVTLWTPWGDVTPPANDNRPVMIGLTGKRNVGKTTAAEILEEEFGFERVHAFGAGKDAAVAWFDSIGCPRPYDMVYGDLKDKPCALLPGGVAPRFFLEKFGHFMGTTMGVEWTLALEISAARMRSPYAPIVVESVVYEAPWFKRNGGVIVRMTRLDYEGPEGIESDECQAGIKAEYEIIASSVEEVCRETRKMAKLYSSRAA